jgi:hypothetical protein
VASNTIFLLLAKQHILSYNDFGIIPAIYFSFAQISAAQ